MAVLYVTPPLEMPFISYVHLETVQLNNFKSLIGTGDGFVDRLSPCVPHLLN